MGEGCHRKDNTEAGGDRASQAINSEARVTDVRMPQLPELLYIYTPESQRARPAQDDDGEEMGASLPSPQPHQFISAGSTL